MKRSSKNQICVITTIKNLKHPSLIENLISKNEEPVKRKPSFEPPVTVKKRETKVRNFAKKNIA